MDARDRTALVIAFGVVVVLLVLFGGGTMTGATMSGGMMGGGTMGGVGWMWIPTVLTLGVGMLLGWALFVKK